MNSVVFLMAIILIVLTLPFLMNSFISNKEAYRENFTSSLGSDMGSYPSSLTNFLLEDSFPIRQNPGILDKQGSEQASKMWWHYPIFKEGSYAQITNNIRYPNNPDVGICTAEDLCGTIYRNRKNKSNYIKPLPPLNPTCGTRVGYFATGINMLPFRTNIPNVLY
jgi:hypothetical protein